MARDHAIAFRRDAFVRASFDVLDGNPNVDHAEVQRFYDDVADPTTTTIALAGAIDTATFAHVQRAFRVGVRARTHTQRRWRRSFCKVDRASSSWIVRARCNRKSCSELSRPRAARTIGTRCK